MASSTLRLTSPISTAAVESHLRRNAIPPNRVRCLSSPSRAAPPLLAQPQSSQEGGATSHSMHVKPLRRLNNRRQDSESISEPKVVGSSHGWLALFSERDGDLFLWNPTTRETIDLPSLETLPISKQNPTPSKVMLSCPPDHRECLAVMAFGCGRRLARCRPGRSSGWAPFGGLRDADQGRLYPDFVFSSRHQIFLCLAEFDGGFDVEIWDLRDDSAVRSSVGIRPNLHELRKLEIPREQLRRYLVYEESSDQLFLVTRILEENSYKTVDFHVHSVGFYDDRYGHRFLNPGMEGKKLSYMEGELGGAVMFVDGVNDSFAVAAADFPELKPNSVYFGGGGDDDIGVFDYEKKTISPCNYSSEVERVHTRLPGLLLQFKPN